MCSTRFNVKGILLHYAHRVNFMFRVILNRFQQQLLLAGWAF
jgi:hypothetical protein